MVKDTGRTGNFEWYYYKTADVSGDSGELVYSKKDTDKFPLTDGEEWFDFVENLKEAEEMLKWSNSKGMINLWQLCS